MNNIIRKALKSTVFLYFILFLAIVNIIGYLSVGQFDAVIVFAIIGFITQSFSKNMIMILVIPLMLTALYVSLFNRMYEGLSNKEDNKNNNKHNDDSKDHHNKDHSKKSSGLLCENHLKEEDCVKPCQWNKDTNKCNSTTHNKKNKEQLAQLHPQWIKDEERTEEEFYKSVDDNVPDLGIQDMANKTNQLIEKQKKLRSSMDKILPLVDQTNKFMDSINFDKLSGVLGGLSNN